MEIRVRLFTVGSAQMNSWLERISIAPLALRLGDGSMSPGTTKCMRLPCRHQHLRLHRQPRPRLHSRLHQHQQLLTRRHRLQWLRLHRHPRRLQQLHLLRHQDLHRRRELRQRGGRMPCRHPARSFSFSSRMEGGALRRLSRTKYQSKAVRRRPALQLRKLSRVQHFVRNVQVSGFYFAKSRDCGRVRTACPPVCGRPRVAFDLDDVLRKMKRGEDAHRCYFRARPMRFRPSPNISVFAPMPMRK